MNGKIVSGHFGHPKRGKEVVDLQVENALLKRALGYRYTEDKYVSVPMEQEEYSQKLFEYMNRYKLEHPEATDDELMLVREKFPKTKEMLVERKVKEVEPDTTAQIFWLKNRNRINGEINRMSRSPENSSPNRVNWMT